MRQDETTAALSRSFGEVAKEYDRLRSGPSDEALDWLIPNGATDAIEIGAGTGILTQLLAARIRHVTAVEPDERMRAVLASRNTGAEVVAGTAEQLPAATGSLDLVIAQSAWHWVDEARASPRLRESCVREAGCRWCGADPIGPSSGCDRCGPGASSSTRREDQTRIRVAAGDIW